MQKFKFSYSLMSQICFSADFFCHSIDNCGFLLLMPRSVRLEVNLSLFVGVCFCDYSKTDEHISVKYFMRAIPRGTQSSKKQTGIT